MPGMMVVGPYMYVISLIVPSVGIHQIATSNLFEVKCTSAGVFVTPNSEVFWASK